jgi:5'(3')-deoxyribonucleotidase
MNDLKGADSKQILVDMDGVLADVYSQFIKLEKLETGIEINTDDIIGKLESDAFPHGDKHVNSIGFFRNAPTIKGSVEGLEYLNNKYKILIVSSATKFPNSLKEKIEWLNEYYPFISWEQMIFCGQKKSIEGDIMIDDHPKNLDTFEGEKIIFTQPHNALIDHFYYKRVNNWTEIFDLL